MGKYSEFVNTSEIKKTRLNKNISAQKMAEMLGLNSKVSYYNIENGETEPRITIILKMSKILGKSPTKFFNFKVQ